MKLTSENVSRLFGSLFALSDEPEKTKVRVEGIVHVWDLRREALKAAEPEIRDLLGQLPSEFMRDGGGGWTFLNLCQDKEGEQWTGLHLIQEQLVVMGIAIGAAEFMMPRKEWHLLPGSVPYVVVTP